MPRLIIIIFIFFIAFSNSYSQYSDSENESAIGLEVGYFNFSTGDRHKGAQEIRPSFHHKYSKTFTLVADFTFFIVKSGDSYSSLNKLALGFKFKPKQNEGFYMKPGVGFFLEKGSNDGLIPSLDFGIGHDFRISRKFDLFAEAEGFLVLPYGFAYSVSAGTKFKFN